MATFAIGFPAAVPMPFEGFAGLLAAVSLGMIVVLLCGGMAILRYAIAQRRMPGMKRRTRLVRRGVVPLRGLSPHSADPPMAA